jgi:hypothetical protein
MISKIGTYYSYLREIEDLLEKKASVLKHKRAKYLKERLYTSEESDEDSPDVFFAYLETSVKYDFDIGFWEVKFPTIFRQSFFLTVYSELESELNRHCRSLESLYNLPKSLEDMGGRPDQSIRRARKYLKEVARVDFPDTPIWAEILAYQKLRNCIVHSNAELERCSYAQFLRGYVSKSRYLELVRGDRIDIKKGFCEEVLLNIDAFFCQLYHIPWSWASLFIRS